MTTEIRTFKAIDSQELFSSLPSSLVSELWDHCPFSFGDANHTLVDAHSVRNWITDIFDDEENEQLKDVLAILDSLAADRVYIDLEN
jgi:hypothetical protein